MEASGYKAGHRLFLRKQWDLPIWWNFGDLFTGAHKMKKSITKTCQKYVGSVGMINKRMGNSNGDSSTNQTLWRIHLCNWVATRRNHTWTDHVKNTGDWSNSSPAYLPLSLLSRSSHIAKSLETLKANKQVSCTVSIPRWHCLVMK